jgi:cell division topological specificity factor
MKQAILNYLNRFKKQNTASLAKERLQIIISHERAKQTNNTPDYLPKLQQEILDVIAKYVKVDRDQVIVQLDRIGDNAILELNVTIPETATEATAS